MKTEKEIIEIAKNKGYEFIEIKNEKTEKRNRKFVYLKCNKCKEVVKIRLDSIEKYKICPSCYPKRKAKDIITKEEIIDMINDKGFEFINFVEYKGARSRVIVKCKNNHMWNTLLITIRQGSCCPKCSKNHRWDYDEVKKIIESENYKLLDDKYINCDTKLNLICPKGHKHQNTFTHFYHDKIRCPFCNLSKGEENIKKFLEDNNIKYIKEKRFKDCKFKNALPFDYYLVDYNTCIEFDGEQHYKPVDYSGKKTPLEVQEDFEFRMLKDTIKNRYCKKNNIKLIRIPYWDKNNIDKYLSQLIK